MGGARVTTLVTLRKCTLGHKREIKTLKFVSASTKGFKGGFAWIKPSKKDMAVTFSYSDCMSVLRANRLRSPKKLQNLQKVRNLRQNATCPWRRTRRRRRSAFESIQINSTAPFEFFRWFNPFRCGSNRVPSDAVKSVMMGCCSEWRFTLWVGYTAKFDLYTSDRPGSRGQFFWCMGVAPRRA